MGALFDCDICHVLQSEVVLFERICFKSDGAQIEQDQLCPAPVGVVPTMMWATVKEEFKMSGAAAVMVRVVLLGLAAAVMGLSGCGIRTELPPAKISQQTAESTPLYRIGPGDQLQIFVWRNPELTTEVPVRPDGRISVPLLEDVVASDKTPTDLAREIEKRLAQYIQDPFVTVIVTGFVGPFTEQIRVVGQATSPQSIPYRANMSMLDVMIAVGGLTEFAAGNRSTLIRSVNGVNKEYRVRIDDLINDGDISANVELLPGDVIIIPESFL